MHDWSLATLADVVKHYAGGLVLRPSLAPTVVRDLDLTAEEQAALVAFIESVSAPPQVGAEPAETSRPVPNK
jgi:cytochrome c peroxidase